MSERRVSWSLLAPGLLVVVLGIAWLLPELQALGLEAGDDDASAGMTAALDELGPDPLVLVGFDADIGTYAEVRPTVRTMIADLLSRDARIAFVSLTVEGRAVALVEQERLRRAEANANRLLDLGFIPGAEAGLVDLTRGIRPGENATAQAFAREVAANGITAFDAIVVVGGNDLGPRSWIEQVAPRIEPIPIAAITPSVLLPEVVPYLASGQLVALLGTPGDGAAYRATAEVGSLERLVEPGGPRPLPILIGLLLAVGVMGQALVARLVASMRSRGRSRRRMTGLFGDGPAEVVGTWVAALATLVVLGSLLGERRVFGWSQHLLAGLATGFLALIAIREVIAPRLIEPLAADPGGRPELWGGVALVAAAAAAPWLPRRITSVPTSVAIGALAAFALGGAVVGTLLPQLAAAIVRPGGGLGATAVGVARRRGHRPRADRIRAWRAARADHDVRGRRGSLAAHHRDRRLARLPRSVAAHPASRSHRLPARRLAGVGAMSQPTARAEMAVLVDVGSAWAKAGVIGQVDGRWRLVAHAAQPTAWGSAALRAALVDQLASAVDSRLTPRVEELLADARRIECHTAIPPRLAIVAVSRELSGSAARRAAEAAGWHVVEFVTLDDGRDLADRLATLQAAEVNAWLVAGGFDGARSPRALEAAALVAAARRTGAGPVVWAGSADLASEVIELFEAGIVSTVANPRPDARRDELGPLRDHLVALLRDEVAVGEETHLASTTFGRAVGALAALSGLRILGVDLGARSAVRVLAEPDGSVASRVRARGGLAGTTLVSGAAARVARLAGDAGDESAVADVLQTLRARPTTLPQTLEELSAMQSAARVQLAAMLEDAIDGPVDLLIGAGRTLAAAPHPGQAARMLLDGVRPLGITQLAVDAGAVLGPLGSLPDDQVREGVSLLGEDLLVPLGTAVVCRGGDAGRPAMRVTLHRAGWPAVGPIEMRTGQLQVLPLPRGQVAEVTIELFGSASLGAARRSPRIQAMVSGGAVGLILDARGVPIALPRRGDDRREVLATWRDTLVRDVATGAERVA